MLSRVANSIYWMNRYIERAENYSRLINVNLNISLDLPPGLSEQWLPLISTTGDELAFFQRYGEATKSNVLDFMVADTENPNSILSCLKQARENARTVRDSISIEMWEHINRTYHFVQEAVSRHDWKRHDAASFFNEVRRNCQLFLGIVDTTISRTEGWHFGTIGHFIERADKTSRFLDMKYFILLPDTKDVGSTIDLMQWTSILKSASAYQMYRRQYSKITPADIAEFLIFNQSFPRSIRFALMQAETSLHAITGTPLSTFSNSAEKKLGQLRSELEYTDIQDIIAKGLHESLDDVQNRLNEIDNLIYETFFAH
jgi:uncharacterized alpha-E superfamily protein